MEQNNPQKTPASPTDTLGNGKLCAALAYVFVGIVWYFFDEKMKKNSFVKFHVQQGVVLILGSIIGQMIAAVIPFLGWMLISPLVSLLSLVLLIIGLANALSDKTKELPLIGQFGKKINI